MVYILCGIIQRLLNAWWALLMKTKAASCHILYARKTGEVVQPAG